MSLNAFIDAQHSFELAISLFESTTTACKHPIFQKARAQALHELGRVFRYQGKYVESQRSLEESLRIYERYSSWELTSKQRVADTLHELGVLEVKKHSLDTATDFLQQSLALRRSMGNQDLSDAKSAATLHQLAAIMVARKPPSLEEAKSLLQEALCLSRQIAQRAATLKQLARVTIRQGDLDRADNYLEQALDLYKELYGENKIHINIAAVKFQQGALALQTEQWDSAWTHFSECLRIRRNVYAYARPLGGDKDKDPTHLEVSCVLHELARVAFAQEYFQKAMDILRSERESLEKLEETSDHHVERIYQARLTNLTWMKKCAKGLCKDDLANKFAHERSLLKKNLANSKKQENAEKLTGVSGYLTEAAMHCRLAARKIALEKDKTGSKTEVLNFFLAELSREIDFTDSGPMRAQALKFRNEVAKWKDQPALERRQPLLKACDELR
jgi:tetratricopeptide (TPR) repeat protein